jgi:hypothetical protein
MVNPIRVSLHGNKLGLDDGNRLVVADPLGAKFKMPRLLYANTAASTIHTNTTDAALFDTQYSIPANTLQAGDVIKVRYSGLVVEAQGTDTHTVALKFGGLSGTTIITSAATNSTTDNIYGGEAEIVIRTIGSSGTFVAVGTSTVVEAAAGTAVQDIVAKIASTSIDTTAAIVVGVSCDWSVAHEDNQSRLDIFRVELW